MRRYILFIVLLMLSASFASAALYCCVDDTTNTCTGTSGSSPPAGCNDPPTKMTYSSVCTDTGGVGGAPGALCTLGCCCANAGTPDADSWNRQPDNALLLNKMACNDVEPVNGYTLKSRVTGKTCSQICLGTGGGTPPKYSVNGIVKNDRGVPLANIDVAVAGSSFTTKTAADGRYTLSNIPEGRYSLVAYKTGCPADITALININQNIVQDFTISCASSTCTPSAPTVSVVAKQKEAKSIVTISLDDNCHALASLSLSRKEKPSDATSSVATFTAVPANAYTDVGPLKAKTEYCYQVTAYFAGLGTKTSTPACFTTGDKPCLANPPNSWCIHSPQESVGSCDDKNNLKNDPICPPGNVCALKTDGTGHYCTVPPKCEECNGIFRILSQLPLLASIGGQYLPCSDNQMKAFCFKDRTSYTTINKYRSCSTVTSCENYNSQDSCAPNPCGIDDTCAWVDVYGEIGKGVCISTRGTPRCSDCTAIFGLCDRQLCEAIGKRSNSAPSECYYDDDTNALNYAQVGLDAAPRCISKNEMACRYYDTKDDCLSPSATTSVVDANYDNAGKRTGTTNSVKTKSKDRFGFGVCAWQEMGTVGEYCYKNADGKTLTTPTDDCSERDNGAPECFQDAIPPVTQVVPPRGLVATHEIAGLEYFPTDDTYAPDRLKTHFCIQKKVTPMPAACYPGSWLIEATGAIAGLEVGEKGTYVIRYYSEDPAGNLETVKSIEVEVIELGFPRVSSVCVTGTCIPGS